MKSSRIFLCLVWMTMSVTGYAQDDSSRPTNTLIEHAGITRQRTEYEAVYLQAQQACYARFAVSDCLRRARRERRVALDELRRQEVALNQRDRQAKALAELNRIQGNVSAERQQELALRRQQALLSTQERQRRSDEKKEAISKPAVAAAPMVSSVPPATDPDGTLKQKRRYLEKLQQARQRKTDKTKALSQQGKGSANPLPIPPGQ